MKKTLIITIVSSVCFLIAGIFIGIIAYVNITGAKKMDFSGDTEEESSIIIIDDGDIQPVDDYDAKEVLGIALGKIATCNKFEVTTTGKSVADSAFIKTDVKANNHRIVIGDEAFIECVSKESIGIATKGSQRFLSNGKVALRSTTNVDDNAIATFDDNSEVEIITNDKYKERYGWLPYQMTGYIINDNTYLEDPIMAKNDDETYTIYVKLDPNSDAAFYYKREVATNANTTYEPIFKKIEFEIKIDSNFVVQEVKIHEEYAVTVEMFIIGKVTSDTTTECVDTYNYDNVSFDESLYNFYKSKLEQ